MSPSQVVDGSHLGTQVFARQTRLAQRLEESKSLLDCEGAAFTVCVIWCYGFENWLESVSSLNAHVKRKGLTWLSTRRFSTTNNLTLRSLTSHIWKSAPFINVMVLVSSRFIVQDRLRIGDFGISKARCEIRWNSERHGCLVALSCSALFEMLVIFRYSFRVVFILSCLCPKVPLKKVFGWAGLGKHMCLRQDDHWNSVLFESRDLLDSTDRWADSLHTMYKCRIQVMSTSHQFMISETSIIKRCMPFVL